MTRRPAARSAPAGAHARAPLVCLTDNGPPRTVETSLFRMDGRDQSWGPWYDGFLRANGPALEALAVTPHLSAEPGRIRLSLRAGDSIGAVPLRAPNTQRIVGGVVVRPRYGWNDIGALLSSAGWAASPDLLPLPLVPGSAREVPPWVIAGPVVHRLEQLLATLRRGFEEHEELRSTPRGQILWTSYACEQLPRGRGHLLPCRFSDLGRDERLRALVRWGLDRVQAALRTRAVDVISRDLLQRIGTLLLQVKDAPAEHPTRTALAGVLHGAPLAGVVVRQGIEALGWLVDERGLAGRSDAEGLAWRMTMHEVFERWVEVLVRLWARGFGGAVTAARDESTTVPLAWERRGVSSLTSLRPDLVVRAPDGLYIIDAKYKPHFEELDAQRWRELAADLREQHRHDVHQALAYAAVLEAERMTTVLVYPVQTALWLRLHEQNALVSRAAVSAGGRDVTVALVAVPIRLPVASSLHEVALSFDALRRNAQ